METDDYKELFATVTELGARTDSRHGPTRELTGVSFVTKAGQVPERARANYRIGAMELCQLVAGTFDPGAIARAAPRAQHHLFTPQMAYGPRVAQQVPLVLRALVEDPLTRQAVLQVARLDDGPSSNLPCTLALQYLARDGELECHVSMRSWDLVKGLPYDLMMFGGLQMVLAACLNLRFGLLRVTAGSAHVYQADVDRGCVPLGTTMVFRVQRPGDLVTWNHPPISAWQAYQAAAAAAVLESWAPHRMLPFIFVPGQPNG